MVTRSIVIDNGSGFTKAGYGGADHPRISFPTLIGKPKQTDNDMETRSIFIGNEAQQKIKLLNLSHPIKNGLVINFDDMEKIWHHTFYNELRSAPEEHPVFLSEVPLSSKSNREKTTEIMFEKFNVPRVYLKNQATLALYAAGRTDGVVVSSGYGVTHTVPIYEGESIPFATFKVDIAGRDLTEYFMKIMTEAGFSYRSDSLRKFVTEMKERLCYVAEDFDEEMKAAIDTSCKEKSFTLPDGTLFTVDHERFTCPEALFKPELLGKESAGVHKTLFNSIKLCNLDIRPDLYGNIVLAGGSTMFEGLRERLNKEIVNLAIANRNVKVIAPPERKYSAWVGGSVIGSLDSFQQYFISREEYDEAGPKIVHRKCY